ncbi:ABC-type tungstate transport system, permease component [Thermanaerovibrio velox DSM 12556]|uniref:ABC-type tungstate transport system, permease component n=1 Tax=Thermanaerovibrio velox DSM 12556 TaxID=926567 RepID=H0UQB7_9BACT|nr:ABC-type tungstate transport system, permease component [Thermanaerovibrio velox DSM 12556]MCX7828715.1 substrate-binding domain-containing protein [Thermanaerothrix sp.]
MVSVGFRRVLRSLAGFLLCIALCLPAAGEERVLRMATTTSTEATGLLDYLSAELRKDTGIELQWVAVGTGKALEYGRRGDVDVVWVHDPKMEEDFVAQGFGVNRRRTMYNDFVLVGPAADPAGIRSATSILDAVGRIASKGSVFVSRGDRSGTHMAELRLWQGAGVLVGKSSPWYVESGQGMMETLLMAKEKGGYTLTDRATFTKFNSQNPEALKVLYQGDERLRNQYSLIEVNPKKHPSVRHHLAVRFIQWVLSKRGQELIGSYKVSGQQLFFPNGDKW